MDQIQAPPRILPAPSPLGFPSSGRGEIPTSNFRGLRVHALWFRLDLFSSKHIGGSPSLTRSNVTFLLSDSPCLPIFPSFVPLCCFACNLQPLLACHAVTPLRLRWFPPPCTVAHYPVGTVPLLTRARATGAAKHRGNLQGKKCTKKRKSVQRKDMVKRRYFTIVSSSPPGCIFGCDANQITHARLSGIFVREQVER